MIAGAVSTPTLANDKVPGICFLGLLMELQAARQPCGAQGQDELDAEIDNAVYAITGRLIDVGQIEESTADAQRKMAADFWEVMPDDMLVAECQAVAEFRALVTPESVREFVSTAQKTPAARFSGDCI